MCNNISDVVKEGTEAECLKTKVLGRSYWHSYLLLYKQGYFYIQDPDFSKTNQEVAPRIGEVQGIALVQELAVLMRKKGYYIHGFYMTGGGNSSNMCNKLTQEALVDWIKAGYVWDSNIFEPVRK